VVWESCADKCFTIDATGCTFSAPDEQYRARLILPIPPDTDNTTVNSQMRTGYEFAARLSGSGFARVKLFRMHAMEVVERVGTPVVPSTEACTSLVCDCE
jgi:hypothetical protein